MCIRDSHKPKWFEKRWFAALPDSKSATYPAVIRVLEDGSSEFIGDSANVVDAACKWFPDAAATLASAEGALADGTAADGMMPSWFGVASTAPTCIEDHRDAEDVTCALMNLHLTSHYFTKLAPLMPRRYQALIDSFAGGDEEDGDDDDDDEQASDSPPAGGTIQFCL